MNRFRRNQEPNYDASPEPSSDPTFDLRQGLIALVLFITFMVALTLVCTYTLEAADDNNTNLTLQVNGAGDFTAETPAIVKQVWEHFLWERFLPYIQNKYEQQVGG